MCKRFNAIVEGTEHIERIQTCYTEIDACLIYLYAWGQHDMWKEADYSDKWILRTIKGPHDSDLPHRSHRKLKDAWVLARQEAAFIYSNLEDDESEEEEEEEEEISDEEEPATKKRKTE